MDKVIIDGVDVSGCNNIDEWEHCNICQVLIKTVPNRHQCLTEGDLRCEFYPDCYYKQLKRLQAENKELKEYKTSKENSYQNLQKEWKQCQWDIRKLTTENERLKEKNKELSESIIRLKNMAKAAALGREKYKYALQEIRVLIKKLDLSLGCAYGDYDNEVIGAEE